jgi:hypothetical protein
MDCSEEVLLTLFHKRSHVFIQTYKTFQSFHFILFSSNSIGETSSAKCHQCVVFGCFGKLRTLGVILPKFLFWQGDGAE